MRGKPLEHLPNFLDFLALLLQFYHEEGIAGLEQFHRQGIAVLNRGDGSEQLQLHIKLNPGKWTVTYH